MVIQRMVTEPKALPKIIKAFKRVWGEMDKEQSTDWRKNLKQKQNENQSKAN
jgi:hypothetical protein